MKTFSNTTFAAFLCGLMVFAVPMMAMATPADDALAQKVEDQLMSGAAPFDATDIIVTAHDGIVSLRGDVKEEEDIQPMISTAQKVPGVTAVETQLDVVEN